MRLLPKRTAPPPDPLISLPATPSSMGPTYVKAHHQDFPLDIDLHQFIFDSWLKNIPNPYGNDAPDHTFDGKGVPSTRAAVVNSATGAQIGWGRLKMDSEKIGASLIKVLGKPLAWEPKKQQQAVSMGRCRSYKVILVLTTPHRVHLRSYSSSRPRAQSFYTCPIASPMLP